MILRRIYLALRALPKSVAFNLRYFEIRDAIKLPVWISHHVWLKRLQGSVVLDVPRHLRKSGLVKIGFADVGIFDRKHSRTIWEVSGKVVFRGKTLIGHGSKISVSGTLVLGGNFTATAETAIVCRRLIEIGHDALLSWDVLIMDTDFHRIYDDKDQLMNEDAPIRIGDQVWIGCRALILKGVAIDDGCVVAANTTLSRSVSADHKVIAGNPPRAMNGRIRWEP